jgi:hypothetical protein
MAMKLVLALAGAFGALVLAAPAQSLLTAGGTPVAPNWINLPADGEIASVEWSGGPGSEWTSGTVTFELAGDGASQLSAMKVRLATNGFLIEDQLSSLDEFMGASAMALAYHPVTGRFLNIVQLETPTGNLLRVSFEDGGRKSVSAQ